MAEKARAAELLPRDARGAGMGMLAATNGLGDLVSSAVVGFLWAAFPSHPGAGFTAAAALQLAGAALLASIG